MEGYFRNQVEMPYYHGTARQRGHGIGSVALTLGRTALPLLRKYVLPAAKRIGREMLVQAVPELMDVVKGNTRVKQALKRTVRKTAIKQLGGGRGKRRKKQTKRKKKTQVTRSKNRKQRSRADILQNLQ